MINVKQLTDKFAEVISIVSSPYVTITVFGILVILAYSQTMTNFFIYSGIFFMLAILFPLIWIFYGVKTNKFSDIHIMIREQRIEPFIVAIIGSFLLVLVYYIVGSPRELIALAAAMTLNGVVFLILTLAWKVSMHAAAFAASILIVSLLVSPIYSLLFLCVPLVIWARLRRKKHSLGQLIVAVILVMAITFGTIKLFNF